MRVMRVMVSTRGGKTNPIMRAGTAACKYTSAGGICKNIKRRLGAAVEAESPSKRQRRRGGRAEIIVSASSQARYSALAAVIGVATISGTSYG